MYKDLTKGKASPLGGVAYLSLEDSEVSKNIDFMILVNHRLGTIRGGDQIPRNAANETFQRYGTAIGWRENCGCPGSPVRNPQVGIIMLSSTSVSNISSYQPAPFFVLDEVDAALDNTNVAKVANYIRAQASDAFQFIVISLKGSLYERGNSLVGIYRDQEVNSSRTLTLDVSCSFHSSTISLTYTPSPPAYSI